MEWLFLFVVLIVVAILVLKAKLPAKANTGDTATVDEFPYQQAGPLFTPAERSFLGVLDQAVAGRARVFGKVRVGDVLSPRKGLQRGASSTARNKIDRKHFDFVLCDPTDLSVMCVIELDDKSHQAKSRQERDDLLLGACKTAGIPMIQVPAKAAYTISAVAELLSGFLPAPEKVAVESTIQPKVVNLDDSRNCPKCSSSLVKRTVKKGEHAGKKILACSTYPACRYYSPMPEGDKPKLAEEV
ncbi:DUF2726 domain-containing protein [Zhongshania aquimaris]|uniref:DUF2726 domain-containing protein n=1 Tax=Zhongshania aquimaris TaxID=2857107 RepID=A0ABS6VRY0_9GAMM|nr:DUF2726 domain-containing protein [Zhongshania aquimaris]MBW2940808.1 DUF2726 domain-containing protein [Zhongshania aquimaris]